MNEMDFDRVPPRRTPPAPIAAKISDLMSRVFGGQAPKVGKEGFSRTQWQETVWQDTRSMSPKAE